MTLGENRTILQPPPELLDIPALDIVAWILLPVLVAILIVWAWRLLKAAAGVLSWVILISLLIFTATRLTSLIP